MNQNQDEKPMENEWSPISQEDSGSRFPYGTPTGETLPKRTLRSTFSMIGLGLFAMLVVQQLIGYILVALIQAVAPQLQDNGWFFWAVSYIPLYLIAYPIMLLIWRRVPNRLPLPYPIKKLPPYAYPLLVAACFAITYTLNLVSMLIAQSISAVTGGEAINPLETAITMGNPWLNLFVVVLVAPVMEELIFRLFLYRKLACFGGKLYVLFSAALFAAFHVNIYQILYAFVLGMILATITYQTGGQIRHAVLLHMCINFLGAGGTPLILHYGGAGAELIVGLIMVLILAAGIFAIVWWFYRKRPWNDFETGRYPAPSLRMIILNPGILLYLLLVLILMISLLI